MANYSKSKKIADDLLKETPTNFDSVFTQQRVINSFEELLQVFGVNNYDKKDCTFEFKGTKFKMNVREIMNTSTNRLRISSSKRRNSEGSRDREVNQSSDFNPLRMVDSLALTTSNEKMDFLRGVSSKTPTSGTVGIGMLGVKPSELPATMVSSRPNTMKSPVTARNENPNSKSLQQPLPPRSFLSG